MLPLILFLLSIVLIAGLHLRGSRRKALGSTTDYQKWLKKQTDAAKRPRSRGGPAQRSKLSAPPDHLGRH